MEVLITVVSAVLSFAAGIITATLRERNELNKITNERVLVILNEQREQIEYWREQHESLRARIAELEREVARLKQILSEHNIHY